MPPKKKAKLKSPVPSDPQDYVAYVRETSRERFDTSSNHNHHRRRSSNSDTIPIEQNVREIRALLKINAEIFSRVMGSASNYFDMGSRLLLPDTDSILLRCGNKTTILIRHQTTQAPLFISLPNMNATNKHLI